MAAGVVFYDSPRLASLWTHGRVSVQDLTPQTAAYTARYVMKKVLGPGATAAYSGADGVCRQPEYAAMSLKPGIGQSWFNKYRTDVYPHDYVIADGTKRRPPRYYDTLLKRADREVLEEVQFQREERGRKHHADNTDERLRVREAVHLASISHLRRDLES